MSKIIFIAFLVLGITSTTDAHAKDASRNCLVPAARHALASVESTFGHVQVLSTCRPGARVRGTRRMSLHSWGGAVDFRVHPKIKSSVVSWLRRNHNGGVMTYPNSSHIHIDVGKKFYAHGYGKKKKHRHAA